MAAGPPFAGGGMAKNEERWKSLMLAEGRPLYTTKKKKKVKNFGMILMGLD